MTRERARHKMVRSFCIEPGVIGSHPCLHDAGELTSLESPNIRETFMTQLKAPATLLSLLLSTIGLAAPAPDPSSAVVGPPSFYQLPSDGQSALPGSSQSETFKAVITAWSQMTNTQYSHVEQWYPRLLPPYSQTKPQQQVDCVGAVSYLLYLGAPSAIADVYAFNNFTDHLYTGWSIIPTPQQFANFFVSLNNAPSPNWQRVTSVADIQAGDVLIIPASYANPTQYVGHALIAAGNPLLLSDGSYALLEFDSTSTTLNHTGGHGDNDSRYWDPRNVPCPATTCGADSGNGSGNTGPSGLGQGTVQISPIPAAYAGQFPAYPFQIAWSVAANHNASIGDGYVGPLIVARPVSQPHTASAQCLFQWAQTRFPKALKPAATSTTFTSSGMTRTYAKTQATLSFSFDGAGSVTYEGPQAASIQRIGKLQAWLSLSHCQ